MEGEREQTRDQNEGSGQQPPLGQQNDNSQQFGQQQGQQKSGQQQGQQPLDQQGNFGTQEPGLSRRSDQDMASPAGRARRGRPPRSRARPRP